MSEDLVITGVGMVTPLGGSAPATWEALLRGESIATHTRLPVEADERTSRVGRLATAAAREATRNAGWDGDAEFAIVVGTSKGPVESWIAAPLPPPSDNAATAGRAEFGLASVASEVAQQLGRPGATRITLSAACASGLHALVRAALMIRHGEATRVLVVAAEASVHPLFLGSFERLGVLAPPGERCRPFDVNRRGFLMSEAAAAVCLEPAGPRLARDPLVRLGPMVMGADASSLVAGDPNGETLRRLLRRCVAAGPVDLYHAHGTGTVLNDALELAAIDGLFAGEVAARPAVYSHKAALGHSLGAAGLLGVVISTRCHVQGRVPANLNTRRRMPAEHVSISSEAAERPIGRSITCATGFGGAMAAVTLENPR